MEGDLPIGESLVAIRRIHFVCGAEVDASEGPIELSFDRSGSYLIRSGPDGESLLIAHGPWEDDFKDPISRENAQYLWESGKWEAIDFGSSTWSYRQFLGRNLDGVARSGSGSLSLDFGGYIIEIRAGGDQTRVKFSRID